MAESVVSFVVENLGVALTQEVRFLRGARDQFERLQREFVSIKGFLKYVDEKHSGDLEFRNWVADVVNIADDVNDVLDAFFLKVILAKGGGFKNALKQCVCMPRRVVEVHKIGKEIETIFSKIEDISERRKRYEIVSAVGSGEGTSSSATINQLRWGRALPHAIDDDIVGLDEEIDTLVAELMKVEIPRSVISICGMGGLGKTTLAKIVYNRYEVKNHFDCQAWTFISQQCRAENVLREILRQISSFSNKEMESMRRVELMEKVCVRLERKRYLVVLDDIWSVGAWTMLESVFPKGNDGSKVVLTTRNREVAENADPWGRVFEPQSLNKEEAWDLLSKKAFPRRAIGRLSSLSDDLEKCGREMVNKCGGLPLAIVILGGILATKTLVNGWKTVSEDIRLYMSKGQSGVLAILGLSYSDLPFHLKPLFLYLGLLLEDQKIPVNSLIQMWIAENLVSNRSEELGRQYLEEMVQRSVVQISERSLEGRVKTCRLHDMMREVCIAKANEENFFEIIGKSLSSSSANSSSSSTKLRRCAIYLEDERYVFPQHMTPWMRSVIFQCTPTYKSSSLVIVYENFKLVEVLQLNGVIFGSGTVPMEFCKVLGKLINLKYLGLRCTDLKELPESIGNLVCLQTLDLRGTYLELPDVIWKMTELRHFYIDEQICFYSGRIRIDTLRKLQTLRFTTAISWTAELGELKNLQKLGLLKASAFSGKLAMDSIVNGFDNLRSLTIAMDDPPMRSSDLERLSGKVRLRKLKLDGKIDSLPSCWPANISKLTLHGTRLIEDPMLVVEKLQELVYLYLSDSAYHGGKMLCSSRGFPRLQFLHIKSLTCLEEWRVEEGAMPCLTSLKVFECDNLKMIPAGLRFVTAVQKLEIIKMPVSFCARVREGGEDWVSIQHIPSILVITDEGV